MLSRDWFSVGVRLFGIWVMYDGFTYLLGYIADRVVQMSRSEIARELDPVRSTPSYYVVFGVGTIALGFFLTSGAEQLTRWAFKEPSPAAKDSSDPPE